jgi:putative transposase
MVTPDSKRKAVAHACAVHGVSQRRACQALRIDRSTVRYSSRSDEASLREAMKAVAAERRRLGYRRIHVMLHRQGSVIDGLYSNLGAVQGLRSMPDGSLPAAAG